MSSAKKIKFVGYSHSWDINNTRYSFRVTEEQFDKIDFYSEIAKEVQEAVKEVFRKHYGDQEDAINKDQGT